MIGITPTHVVLAGALAVAIVLAAWCARALSRSGALAAFIVGFVIFCFGGVPMAAPLLAFFISSSLLSRVGRARKARLAATYEKGSARDAWQVMANGGIPAVLAIIFWFGPVPRFVMLLFLAALAAVNADTWATEIGALSGRKPRLVTTLSAVEPGTSGAVSWLGLLAALAGAVFIVICGALAWPARSPLLLWPMDGAEMLAVTWAGFVAAFADSILGASLQAQYRCVKCGTLTERREHCDMPAKRARGLAWMNNDTVNLITSLLGAGFAWLLIRLVANRFA